MDDKQKRALIEEAFLLGFMVTREGYNGECMFENCAARGLNPELGSETEFREIANSSESFKALREEALKRLNSA